MGVLMNFDDIAFSVGDGDTLIREHATVADLIKALQEFPPDLPVSASFRCHLDEHENIVFLEDEKLIELLDILLDCPMCSQCFKITEPTIN